MPSLRNPGAPRLPQEAPLCLVREPGIRAGGLAKADGVLAVSRHLRPTSFLQALRAELREAGPYLVLMALGVGALIGLVLWLVKE